MDYLKTSPNGQHGQNEDEEGFFDLDIKTLLFRFLRNWYWFVIGIGLGIGAAWLELRYAIPIYNVGGSILIKDESYEGGISENVIIEDLGFKSSSRMTNELQILKSRSLMRKVVDSLKINVTYFTEGRIKTTELYPHTPVKLSLAHPKEIAYGKSLRINPIDSNRFSLVLSEVDTITCYYGIPFSRGQVNYKIDRVYDPPDGSTLLIRIDPPDGTAQYYANQLNLTNIPKSNILLVGMADPVPLKAIHIINKLVKEYDQNIIVDKNQVGRQTLNFINERLQFVTNELYQVEKEVESFKRTKEVPLDVSLNAQRFISEMARREENLMEIELKEMLLANIENTFKRDSNRTQPLPLVSEVISGTLSGLIASYNRLILERENLMTSATPDNPAAKQFIRQMEDLETSITLSIQTIKEELAIRKNQLVQVKDPLESKIDSIPTNERELLSIMRQQKIKENLFLYLLQKKEDTALSLAAQIGNTQVIDPPVLKGMVSPNRRKIIMMYVILGLGIPGAILFLIELLNNKIYNKRDIEKQTDTPFLGAIASAPKNKHIVVNQGSRSAIAEMFRLLRTNINFVTKTGGKSGIYLITSCVSGEGKTFITINLGLTMAHSNQRTILIGLDLRKPKLAKYINPEVPLKGVTNYLIGESPLNEIISQTGFNENLYYIPSGPIPPNPSELLMTERLESMIEELKKQFDCILIDTAPVGLVTDALLLDKHVNTTIFVTRFGKSVKGSLKIIDDIYRNKKLPKPGIVLNGVKVSKGYGYGNSYGYGHGYGYGYGYGYYQEDGVRKKRGILGFRF